MPDLLDRLQAAIGPTYTIERELGGGGMSRVYLAEETALGRHVVIKRLADDVADAVSAGRFAREVRLAATLQHPNIVPLLTAGEADGVPYYVMPFVRGQSLRGRMSGERMPTTEALGVLRDVARALAYAHAQGVVHRDIKPENVLLSGDVAVVTDFGIARAISAARTGTPAARDTRLTSIGTSLGTPAYMAPEQIAGEDVDAHADLYAWGVMAYELLSGVHPFAAATTAQQLMAAHMAERPAPLRERAPDVPPHVAGLVAQCLEKDPARRPADAAALVTALGTVATPAAAPGRAPARRRTGRIVALLAALALVGAGAWWALRPVPRDPHRVVLVAPNAVSDVALAALGTVPDAQVVAAAPGTANEAWSRTARSARAAIAVVADVRPRGDSVDVAFRVFDAVNGEVIRALPPATGRLGAEAAVARTAIDPALSVLGFLLTPQLGPATVPRTAPPSYAAFKELAGGLALWYRIDSTSGRVTAERIERATRLDTAFFQARLWLALSRTGSVRRYTPGAGAFIDSVNTEAAARSETLTPYESAFADFLRATSGSNGESTALEALRRIERLAPGSPLVVQLPQLLANQNLPRQALDAEARVWNATGSGTGDSALVRRQHFLFLASLHHYVGRDADAIADARHALAEAPGDLGAMRELAVAQVAAGDLAGLHATLDRVAASQTSEGFGGFAGDVYNVVAQEAAAHGRAALGDSIMRLAIAWYDTRTTAELQGDVRFRAALAYLTVGRVDDAMAILRWLRAGRPNDSRFLGAIGRAYAQRGDTVRARAVLDTLAAMPAAQLGGAPTYERADIVTLLGRRDEAVRLLREALAQGVGFGFRRRLHWFKDLRTLRGYPPFEALITPAG